MSKNTKKNNATKKVEKIESTEEKTDTIIDAKEMAMKVEERIGEKQEKVEKKSSHIITHSFLIILCLVSLVSFGVNILNRNSTIISIVQSLLITIFTSLFSLFLYPFLALHIS